MISCDDAVRQLWEYLDNDLDRRDAGAVDHHLALCRRCCGEAEFVVELRELLRSATRCDPPAAVQGHLETFLDRLEASP